MKLKPARAEGALKIVKARRKMFADYDAAVEDWYQNDAGRAVGRGGYGYSFPACIHGSSYWTDYDNICGYCEDGWNRFDYIRELGRARDIVAAAYAEVDHRHELARPVIAGAWKNGANVGETENNLINALMDWALAPLSDLEKNWK